MDKQVSQMKGPTTTTTYSKKTTTTTTSHGQDYKGVDDAMIPLVDMMNFLFACYE